MANSKKQIMDAAITLFLQKTYREVSIQEITDAVGVTKGAFYYFFKSKEELFFQIVDQFSLINKIDFDSMNSNSLFDFFHQYLDALTSKNSFLNTSKNQDDINHYFLTFDALKIMPDFRKKMWANEEKEMNTWIRVIKNAKKNGEIKSQMADRHIAEIFNYTIDGIGMRKIMQNKKYEIGNTIKQLWEEFYELLKE
ncbi:MAG: TetR/AcrR family transcriptional regulator [Spirochaetes bacterium]|nr:TetR/AcrR family transcriptional regulator [Spirochaetota bacterium]